MAGAGEAALPPDRIEIAICAAASPDLRAVTTRGSSEARSAVRSALRRSSHSSMRLRRMARSRISIAYLQGDASPRAYARLVGSGTRF